MNKELAKERSVSLQEPNEVNLPTLVRSGDLTLEKWTTLKEVIWPNASDDKIIEVAYNYCKARHLDPMKKMVHIVKYGDKEVILPGIAEPRATASRTGLYVGKDSPVFGPDKTETWKWTNEWKGKTYPNECTITYPEWVEQTVYRLVGGIKCPFVERVWWKEAYATVSRKSEAPNEMWRERPYGQISKCGEAASLRCAFPEELGGILTAEEMEGRHSTASVAPSSSKEEKLDPVLQKIKEKEDANILEGEIVVDNTPKLEKEKNKELTEQVQELSSDPKPGIFVFVEEKEFKLEDYRIIKKGKPGSVQYDSIQSAFAALAGIVGGYKYKVDRVQISDENKILLTQVEKAGLIDNLTEFKDLINEGV